MKKYRISVKDLVSYYFQSGDLGGGGILNSSRAQTGIAEHKKVQESRGEEYLKEYSLKLTVEHLNIFLEVYGRADGIYSNSDPIVIEEIKTTTTDEVSESHLAQAKLYGYLYIVEKNLLDIKIEIIKIKLLYINIETQKTVEIDNLFTKDELKLYFESIVNPYLEYLNNNYIREKKRDESLIELKFPFSEFRRGQREFSINVYRAIRDSKILFARAPTGTGKSIATIFPGLKAMGEELCSKIFYLTAKTVGRHNIRETITLLRDHGARIRSVIITAKEKICINDEFNCNPDKCKYAKGYYDKVGKALLELTTIEDFYEDNIKKAGFLYNICPFELSLDLTNQADIIVCDYNYIFDLRVYLKRYFDGGKSDFVLLIDEAHNLPDRLRSSYSCKISREEVSPVMELLKEVSSSAYKSLKKLNKYLLEMIKEIDSESLVYEKVPEELIKLVKEFIALSETVLLSIEFKGKNLFLELYYNFLFFIKLLDYYNESNNFLQLNTGGLGIEVEIVCNDPSQIFTKMLLKTNSQVFFSGSLHPLDYYKKTLIKDCSVDSVNINSPFNSDRLKIIAKTDIFTTYKERDKYYQKIAELIKDVTSLKKGNYIAFFPSYSFMEEVSKYMNQELHIQKPFMSESERSDYINEFSIRKKLLSFAILGGLFGEGIDLEGDKLIGVIIVGVGLPQISVKNSLIQKIFDYNYAYVYPGFNKVLQAVGRVIRNEKDRGIALLIDHRFKQKVYKDLFPREWSNMKYINNSADIKNEIDNFWSNDD